MAVDTARPLGALIAGAWLTPDATGPERSTVRAPWSGAPLGQVALASPATVERAIAAAHGAAEANARVPWPLHERIAVLDRVAGRLAAEREAIASTLSAEAGKPITLALAEVDRAVATFRESGVAARTVLGGEVLALDAAAAAADRLGILRRFPLGAVAAITPFNFPLNLVAHKLAPAVAAGCPVVLKPAPQTPLTAWALAAICLEAGLPAGFLQVVACTNETAAPLVEDPRLPVLSFTGSAQAGWALKARAPQKRVLLELGGTGTVIVDECRDLGAVAARIAQAAHAYAGQTCISVQRVLAQRALAAPLRAALAEASAALPCGDPARPDTVVGPVIDDRAATRIATWVDTARAGGATVHGDLARAARLLHPVLLEDVPADHPLLRDEVFGPVATVEAYDDLDDAVDRVNAGAYGLQAGIFVRDVDRLLHAFDRLRVGGVVHDDCPTFRADAMPYGGSKASGIGREGPRWAIAEMTEERLLVVRRGPHAGTGSR